MEQLLATRPAELGSAPTDAPNLCILVVDDDPVVLRVCERQMARWPMRPQVFGAANGYEALVRIGMNRPDLLITDLQMPEMDGFQMLQHLKRMPELATITIVAISGLDPAEIAASGGVPDGIPILPKPIPFDRLRDIATVVAAQKRPLPGPAAI